MSDRTFVISAQTPSSEFRNAEARLLRSAENAKSALERAFAQLNELERALNRLGEMASALESLSTRLANLTITTASKVVTNRRSISKEDTQVVEDLASVARDAALSARSLDYDIRRAKVATADASTAVSDSIRSLDGLAPDLATLRARRENPEETRSVVIPVLTTRQKRPQISRPDIVRDTWPAEKRDANDLKN